MKTPIRATIYICSCIGSNGVADIGSDGGGGFVLVMVMMVIVLVAVIVLVVW